ncbi:MAG: hypothetical protein RRY33_02340 [Alistipes sp.]
MKKIFFVIGFLGVVALCACTKDEDSACGRCNAKTMDVLVQIGVPAPSSRAIGSPTQNHSALTVQRGRVFFIADDGSVVSQGVVAWDQIAQGQLFKDVRTSATEVYVVANYLAGSDTDLALARCITKAQILNLSEKMVELTGIQYIMLSNAADLTGYDVLKFDAKIKNGVTSKEAHVLLSPIHSRLEISDLMTNDPTIVKCTMKGIYVDNFYPSLYMACHLGGAGTKVFGGQEVNHLDNPIFVNKDRSIPELINGKIQPSKDSPESVWHYQTAPTLGGVANVPRLVIVFSTMTLNVNGVTSVVTNKFLTVTGFKDGQNKRIQNFEAGKVYQIPSGALVFNYSDLENYPNPLRADVVVGVTVKPWTEVSYAPNL